MSKTVTFQTVLDIERETLKAFKIYQGSYLAKSLVTVEPIATDTRTMQQGKRTVVAPVQIVNVTMPRWLADRL